MIPVKDAAAQFLGRKRIAVTGVSRTPGSHGGNIIYKRLRERGYETFAVNPNADEVEGDQPAMTSPRGRARTGARTMHAARARDRAVTTVSRVPDRSCRGV